MTGLSANGQREQRFRFGNVAGTLQDYNRALIAGSPTYGKANRPGGIAHGYHTIRILIKDRRTPPDISSCHSRVYTYHWHTAQ